MKKMMRMFATDENYKLQIFIEKVKTSDSLKVEQYKNMSAYVNPSALRLGCQSGQKRAYYMQPCGDYSPV